MKVLLLDGNENQSVAAARSLGRAGHHVIVASDAGWSKAGLSRFARERWRYPSPRATPEAFLDALVAFLRERPGTLLMPMTERTLLPISRARERLTAAGAQLVLAPRGAVEWATNKAATQQSALAAGARIPRTVVVSPDTPDPAGTVRSLRAPLVIKATQSEHMGADGRLQATGAPQYARTYEDATRVLALRVAAGMTVQVQEFVEGGGAGWFAFMDHGRLVAEFAHRRLRDVRPTGSGSALRESVAVDPRLRDIGLAMLEEQHWHGVAMVEFRMDDEGEPVFLEVNGRFWNSLALAIHAGVDFPRLCADAVLGQLPTTVPSFKTGVRCRWLLGDARHLLAVMRGAPAGFPGRFPGRWSTLASMLVPHPGTFHDNFQLDDPLPELGDWADLVVHRIPGLLSR